MINLQPTSAIEFFAVFITITVRVSLNLSFVTTCLFGGIMANFDINVFIIAREKFL